MNTNEIKKDTCCRDDIMGYEMPVYECPQERIVDRYINHTVPHIMPINTRIINHHVMNHEYIPYYTCCEENVIENKCCR